MQKQKLYTGSSQSVFAIAKNYEHGARPSELTRRRKELASDGLNCYSPQEKESVQITESAHQKPGVL